MRTQRLRQISAGDLALREARRLIGGHTMILTGGVAGSEDLRHGFEAAGAVVQPLVLESLPGPIWKRLGREYMLLASPPPDLAAAFERLDPDGVAIVYAGSATTPAVVLGRRIIGNRRAKWAEAESRGAQLSILGRKETRVTLEKMSTVLAACPHQGLVFVKGVPRRGLSLGSAHNFCIPTASSGLRDEFLAGVVDCLLPDCDEALLSRCELGAPLTVYGYVAGVEAATWPPVLALVFVDRQSGRVVAPGIVHGVPLDARQRSAAGQRAREIGAALVASYGYRGAFGVDGIWTGEAWSPHDVNPRVCAGFRAMDQTGLGGLHPSLWDVVLREAGDPAPLIAELGNELSHTVGCRVCLWDDRDPLWHGLAKLDPSGIGFADLLETICSEADHRGYAFLAEAPWK